MEPVGSCTERQASLDEVEDLEPKRIFVLEENGFEKDADEDVRSPPTIYPFTHTPSSPTEASA